MVEAKLPQPVSAASIEQATEALLRGDLVQARSAAESLAANTPDKADGAHLLGLLEVRENRLDRAVQHFEKAVALSPNRAAWWRNLGLVLVLRHNYRRAVVVLSRAVELGADDVSTYKALGAAAFKCGHYEQSLNAYRDAHNHNGEDLEAAVGIAKALIGLRRYGSASEILEAVLQEEPDRAEAHALLADAYARDGMPHRALGCREQVFRLQPDSPEAKTKLAAAYWNNGCLRRSLDLIQPLVETGRISQSMHSFYLSGLLHDDGRSATTIRDAHRHWAVTHLSRISAVTNWSNDRDPERRIRVGYMGGDFYENPSFYFLIDFFRNHDHTQFEVIGYDLRGRNDARTAEFRRLCNSWRNCSALKDDEIIDFIRADAIDVLVDTTAHYAGNRLHLFASRPAPVQISIPNYPATTGLDCFDGIVTDAWVCPEGTEHQYTESPLRLQSGYLPYSPPELAPDITSLPALQNGFITFALLQRPVKISRTVWDAIAAVMHRTPASRVLIHNAFEQLKHPDSLMQRIYRDELGARGVDSKRLIFAGPCGMEQHLKIVAEADLALDTFPYNGQTTTCECLWMGLPVVTVTGGYHVARVGRSLLQRAGFPEWETTSPESYIEVASNLAGNIDALASLRQSMRPRVSKSLLLNGRQVTGDLENTYRSLWQAHCRKAKSAHV